MKRDDDDELLTKLEAREILKVSRSTFDRMLRLREVPFYKFGAPNKRGGATVRVKRKDIRKLIESYRVEAE